MHTKQNRSVNDPACQLPVWNLRTLIFKPSRTPLPKINISLSKNQIIHWILSSQLRVKFIVLEWISWSQCRQVFLFFAGDRWVLSSASPFCSSPHPTLFCFEHTGAWNWSAVTAPFHPLRFGPSWGYMPLCLLSVYPMGRKGGKSREWVGPG